MGLIDDIKNQVKKSGANKGKIVYFKQGVKVRVRFLQDMDDGMKMLFHDSFSAGVNEPCQELYDRECKYHDDEELRHRDLYIWSVFEYDSKEAKLLMGAVNNCSPVPQLVGFYETYGTLTDRDYIITKTGQQQNTTFSVVPMDKVKFRNDKAKPYSESKTMAIIDKAFPSDEAADDDDDFKESKGKDKSDYKSMTAKELYDLCKGRDIEAVPRKDKKVYIELLEEADSADSDDDGWGDEDDKPDYSEMSALELYKLCKEKDIDVEPRKKESYYITKLEASDSDSNGGDDDDW